MRLTEQSVELVSVFKEVSNKTNCECNFEGPQKYSSPEPVPLKYKGRIFVFKLQMEFSQLSGNVKTCEK